MSIIEIVLTIVLIAIFIGVILLIIRSRKKGKKCFACSGCSEDKQMQCHKK